MTFLLSTITTLTAGRPFSPFRPSCQGIEDFKMWLYAAVYICLTTSEYYVVVAFREWRTTQITVEVPLKSAWKKLPKVPLSCQFSMRLEVSKALLLMLIKPRLYFEVYARVSCWHNHHHRSIGGLKMQIVRLESLSYSTLLAKKSFQTWKPGKNKVPYLSVL